MAGEGLTDLERQALLGVLARPGGVSPFPIGWPLSHGIFGGLPDWLARASRRAALRIVVRNTRPLPPDPWAAELRLEADLARSQLPATLIGEFGETMLWRGPGGVVVAIAPVAQPGPAIRRLFGPMMPALALAFPSRGRHDVVDPTATFDALVVAAYGAPILGHAELRELGFVARGRQLRRLTPTPRATR